MLIHNIIVDSSGKGSEAGVLCNKAGVGAQESQDYGYSLLARLKQGQRQPGRVHAEPLLQEVF